MNKRYFIVVYQSYYTNGMSGTSQLSCDTNNGNYLNCQSLVASIKQIVINGLVADQVIITNIIELNKADYMDWNHKYEENKIQKPDNPDTSQSGYMTKA